jgi:hypothetical protein
MRLIPVQTTLEARNPPLHWKKGVNSKNGAGGLHHGVDKERAGVRLSSLPGYVVQRKPVSIVWELGSKFFLCSFLLHRWTYTLLKSSFALN